MINQATQILAAFLATESALSEAKAAMHASESAPYHIARPERANGELMAAKIDKVVAVEIKKGFKIVAVMLDGSMLTIKEKSSKKPTDIQLNAATLSGNARPGSPNSLFTFTKQIKPKYKALHLKTYTVQ